jgi:hypothetical protein
MNFQTNQPGYISPFEAGLEKQSSFISKHMERLLIRCPNDCQSSIYVSMFSCVCLVCACACSRVCVCPVVCLGGYMCKCMCVHVCRLRGAERKR